MADDAVMTLSLGDDPMQVAVDRLRPARELERELRECRRCTLADTRVNVVAGEGSASPSLVVVGDAPTRTQGVTGRTSSGAAGHLVDNVLVDTGFRPDEVFVTHLVKCHPGTQVPDRTVVENCSGLLLEQLARMRPRVIVTLGPVVAATLLRRPIRLDLVAGFRFEVFEGVTLIPTHHPVLAVKANHTQSVEAIRRDFAVARAVLDGKLSNGHEAMARVRALAAGQ